MRVDSPLFKYSLSNTPLITVADGVRVTEAPERGSVRDASAPINSPIRDTTFAARGRNDSACGALPSTRGQTLGARKQEAPSVRVGSSRISLLLDSHPPTGSSFCTGPTSAVSSLPRSLRKTQTPRGKRFQPNIRHLWPSGGPLSPSTWGEGGR